MVGPEANQLEDAIRQLDQRREEGAHIRRDIGRHSPNRDQGVEMDIGP